MGGVTGGNWASARVKTATPPASVITIDTTEAKIGRSMKNRENTRRRSLANDRHVRRVTDSKSDSACRAWASISRGVRAFSRPPSPSTATARPAELRTRDLSGCIPRPHFGLVFVFRRAGAFVTNGLSPRRGVVLRTGRWHSARPVTKRWRGGYARAAAGHLEILTQSLQARHGDPIVERQAFGDHPPTAQQHSDFHAAIDDVIALVDDVYEA